MGEAIRRRVTYGQLEHLWEFLDKHKDIAMGYNKNSQAREFSRRMWEEISINLNSHGDGAVKDWKGWCKYWNDYKSKLKRLSAAAKMAKQKTGGGPSNIKPLTDIEKKFLHIMGDDYGCGLPGIRVEPFDEENLNQVQIEIVPPDLTTPSEPPSESILVGITESHHEVDPGPSRKVPNLTHQPTTHFKNPRPIPTTPTTPSQLSVLSPILPRRSPRRRLLLASPNTHPGRAPSHTQLSPAPHQNPQIQRTPTTIRRRQLRREPPMTAEKARRALIAESQKQTKLRVEQLNIFKLLLKEMREIKEIMREG